MANLIGEKKNLIEKQISMQAAPVVSGQSLEQNNTVSSDIMHLLDLLARIEMRRQARQRLADKEKAS